MTETYARLSAHFDKHHKDPRGMEYLTGAMLDRFVAKISLGIESDDECWHWCGAKSAHGYGYFDVNGKLLRAHRLVYQFVHGGIPEGAIVRHRCDKRDCV